jgi:pimeloyl-ACP methyl ester carboxylesterase
MVTHPPPSRDQGRSAPGARRPGGVRRRLRRTAVVLAGLAVTLTVASVVVNAMTGTPRPAPAGLDHVLAGDVRTRIRTWGTAGSPIVLVHGAAESADTWEPVAERLALHHRVYALDSVGWGYSQRVAPYGLDHQTRQLLALLDALDLTRPVLVGHSSGAAVVAEAALRAPDRVGGVLLLDGDALATGAGERTPLSRLVLPPWRTTVLRLAVRSDALIRSVYSRQCGPRCPALDAAGVDAWRRPFQVEGAEAGLWGMLEAGVPGMDAGRLAGLAALRMPTAVVFGAEDDVFPAGTPEQTAARIGAPPPLLIPGARHLTMISDPGTVADAVLTLCDRVITT